MTANKRLNLWMASTTAERDALGSTAGVTRGDFCLVDGLNLYVATAVLAGSSSWLAIAGAPTTGPIALGGKNTADAANRSVFVQSAVSFRAALDGTPSSITLTNLANVNWPAIPSPTAWTATGFTYWGESNVIAANTGASMRGTYVVK